ncbi:hypothetical protein EU513_15245 [Yimella sp. RIT 621]|nr:hypothetical protein EU513_15245 [Yimella sp. RIT 621]
MPPARNTCARPSAPPLGRRRRHTAFRSAHAHTCSAIAHPATPSTSTSTTTTPGTNRPTTVATAP